MIEIVGATTRSPGEEGIVRIYPVAPDQWHHVQVGTAVEMTDGPPSGTAAGTVTDVSRLGRHVPERDA